MRKLRGGGGDGSGPPLKIFFYMIGIMNRKNLDPPKKILDTLLSFMELRAIFKYFDLIPRLQIFSHFR